MPAPTRSVRRPYPGVVARLSGLAGIGLLVSLVCALVITFSWTNPPESYAQPAMPHQFVGTVKINGTTAPDGTVVTATIDGVEAATAIVTGGNYQLKILNSYGLPDPIGKTIKFTVGGQIANESQLFQAGGGTELNLTVTLVPPDVGAKDWFPNWSPFLSQTPPSPGNGPNLSEVLPNTAYPRQLVSLKGETAGTRVVWDVGNSREADVSPVAPITKDYFQIPAGASPGVHKVAIRNSSGTSNAVKVTVLAPSGDFPAPRIEDVVLRLQPSGKWILMLTAANLDADATVTVDSTQADSALISGLPISYMKDHIPDTFKYPVYHYSQLAIVAPDLPAGATLTLMTTNAGGKSDSFSYRLPADWKDVDSDGDGLLDRWEEGTYTAPSGTTIDLAAMGVHKHKKDILIEADWVKVAAPPEVVWTKLEEAFANAPVLNPDGTSGVNIIVDRGQGGAFLGGGDLLTPNHQSMSYSSRYFDHRSAWYPVPSTPAPAPAPGSLFWDFENQVDIGGGVSKSVGLANDPWIVGFASQTGGGPGDYRHITRYLGKYFPYIEFTTSKNITLDSLEFQHIHNHNPRYPTNPSYDVQLQFDSGSGYSDIGPPLTLSSANSGNTDVISLGSIVLEPGTYKIRWVSRNLAFGSDTGSEFFAMDDLILYASEATPPPEPATGIVVTNLNDSGPGSLRQAISDLDPGDSITFDVTGTISLKTQLDISKDVKISGPGVDQITISGNDSVRV